MSVGQHVTWAESGDSGGGGGGGDRQQQQQSGVNNRSRSTEQLDRLLRGLDELSGTLPDLGGRRSASRERESGQPDFREGRDARARGSQMSHIF